MRTLRFLSASLAVIALAAPCWAHGHGELGHHWEMPEYRTEMLTQIAIMAAAALAVLTCLWLTRAIQTRRMRG